MNEIDKMAEKPAIPEESKCASKEASTGKLNRALTFTGWVQREDFMDAYAKALGTEALHMEYQKYASEDEAFSAFGGIKAEWAIGWSLGGMVMMRAAAAGAIKVKKLLLLASSYRFAGEYGVKEAEYAAFKSAFRRDSLNTVLEFQKRISNPPLEVDIGEHAGYWLDRLGLEAQQFSNSAGMVIMLGENDKTTPPAQKQLWLQHYPAAKIHILPGVGHVIPAEALCMI